MRSIALDDLLQRKRPGASLHDASVEGYYFDARRRSLEFYVRVAFYGPAGKKPRHVSGVLTFSEVLSFQAEPPGNGGTAQRSEGLWLTAEGSVESLAEMDRARVPALLSAPERAFHHYLYFSDLNAFMFIAALHAEFAWREVADQRRGGAV
jgi:hypothetical protein